MNKAEIEICAMESVDEESPRIDSPVQAPLMQIEQIIDAHSMEADTNAQSVDDDPVPIKVEKKWSQWTPSSLRTKVSSPLKRKRVSNSVPASTTARSDLYELECKLVQEKHEMVMAQQKIEKSRASAVHTITIANMLELEIFFIITHNYYRYLIYITADYRIAICFQAQPARERKSSCAFDSGNRNQRRPTYLR